METRRLVKLGYYVPKHVFYKGKSAIKNYLYNKTHISGQILLALRDYLGQYAEKVGKTKIINSIHQSQIKPGGSLSGLVKYVNQSLIDVAVQTTPMDETTTEAVGFAYPYKLSPFTFVTSKPKYEPHLFGIFQTFSPTVWLALVAIFVVVALVYCAAMKRKYSPDKILLHVLGVLLRQSAILRSNTVGRKLLFMSWVLGAMILCLSHDSVFLSFLSFPPANPINNQAELAAAVERGDYHCLAPASKTVLSFLNSSEDEDLRVIATDLEDNNVNKGNRLEYFIHESGKQKLAYLLPKQTVEALAEKYFVAKESFMDMMSAMMVRKDFCYKELLENFVHKIMAAGLYLKYVKDRNYLASIATFLKYPEEDAGPRKLTLTDLAPAFVILLAGYLLSFLVFLGEVLLGRKKKTIPLKKRKNKVCTDVYV